MFSFLIAPMIFAWTEASVDTASSQKGTATGVAFAKAMGEHRTDFSRIPEEGCRVRVRLLNLQCRVFLGTIRQWKCRCPQIF